MRVVYLNPLGQLGGAETSLLEMLRQLRLARPDWHLSVITGSDGLLIPRLRDLGVYPLVLPFPDGMASLGESARSLPSLAAAGPETFSYIRRLKRCLEGLAPNLIHAAGFKMQILACWAAPKNVPLLWHIHDFAGRRRVMKHLMRAHARRCTQAIVNSQSVAADFRTVAPRLPCKVVYNAIDTDRFSPAGAVADLDALSGLAQAPPNTVRIGLPATFARWKGHLTFLDAMAQLAPDLPVRGYIVGGSIYQTGGSQWTIEELRDEASRRGLQERVGFTGFLEDPASSLRALDIVVHASTEPEPFGMVIAEGMACGKAVIASRAGGATEIFTEGVDALAHTPGSSQDLSLQLRRLVLNVGLRRELGSAARRKMESAFSGAQLTRGILETYEEVSQQARIVAGPRPEPSFQH